MPWPVFAKWAGVSLQLGWKGYLCNFICLRGVIALGSAAWYGWSGVVYCKCQGEKI